MTDPGAVALLRRTPGSTRAAFRQHWLHRHAPLVLPWALARGCSSYIQYHNISAADAGSAVDVDVAAYDGGAVLRFGGTPPPNAPPGDQLDAYFAQVIAPDELRFLVGPAQETARFVDEQTIKGEKIILIENGKIAKGPDGRAVIDMTEAWKRWEAWGFDAASLQ